MNHVYIIGSKYPFYLNKMKNRIRNFLISKNNYSEYNDTISVDKILFYFDKNNQITHDAYNFYYIKNNNDFNIISGIVYDLLTKAFEIKTYYYVFDKDILDEGYNEIINEKLDTLTYLEYKEKKEFYISEKKEECIDYITNYLNNEIFKTKELLNKLKSLKNNIIGTIK